MSDPERYMVNITTSRRHRLSVRMLKYSGGRRDKTSARWFIRPSNRDAFMDLGVIVHYGGIITDGAGQEVSTDRLFILAQQHPAVE